MGYISSAFHYTRAGLKVQIFRAAVQRRFSLTKAGPAVYNKLENNAGAVAERVMQQLRNQSGERD